MPVVLAAALILVVLAASDAFSDFDAPKALVLGLALPAAALGAWPRLSRVRLAAPGLGRLAAALAILLALLAALSARSLGVPFSGSLVGLAWPVAGLTIFVLALGADVASRGFRAALIAGAFSPAAVLAAEGLLAVGLFPLDVPHRAGVFTATLGNRGLVGELGVLALPFVAMVHAGAAGGPRHRLVAAAAALCAAVVIGASGSRAAWLGAAAFLGALAAAHALSPREAAAAAGRRHAAVLAAAALVVAAVVAAVLGGHGIVERAASIVDPGHPTNRVRLGLWQDAVELGLEHPATGVGPGRFGAEHAAVRSADEWAISGLASHAATPHSEPLRLLAESGFPGALGAIGLALATLVAAFARARRAAGEEAGRARAVLAGLVGVFTVSAFWFTFAHPVGVTFTAAFAGLGLARATTGAARAGVAALAIAAAVVLIGLAERDAAAVLLRDRAESEKASVHAAARATGTLPVPELERLGATARAIPDVMASSFLSPTLRHRLALTIVDLAGERRRLAAAGEAGDDEVARAARRAAEAFPGDAAVRAALADAVARAPRHVATQRLMGALETELGFRPEAIARYRALIDANPDVPLVRTALAVLLVDARVHERAVDVLAEETRRYPDAPESAAAWELHARALGATGRIAGALEIVDAWVARRGESPAAAVLRGELALRLGQSLDTLYRSRPAAGEPDLALLTAIDEARHLDGPEAASALLRLAGRHPDEPLVLDALQEVLERAAAEVPGPRRAEIETLRSHALARAKTLYAWQHLAADDRRMVRISSRAARRLETRQWDAYLVEALAAARAGEDDELDAVLVAWRDAGFEGFELLTRHPELDRGLRRLAGR